MALYVHLSVAIFGKDVLHHSRLGYLVPLVAKDCRAANHNHRLGTRALSLGGAQGWRPGPLATVIDGEICHEDDPDRRKPDPTYPVNLKHIYHSRYHVVEGLFSLTAVIVRVL